MSSYFSIIIATYNDADVLPRAVRSLVGQSFEDLEIVVVDDGSEDETEAVVNSFSDHRIKYLRAHHQGTQAARNNGARAALGRFVAFIDSDDEALPRWLEFMHEALQKESASVARCGVIHVGTDGFLHKITFIDPNNPLAHFGIPGTYVLERDLFIDVGGFNETLRFGENTELSFRLAERNTVPTTAVVQKLLIRRRWSGGDLRYEERRAEMASYCLATYGKRLRRRTRAAYGAAIGVHAARSGDLRRARQAFADAWLARPWGFKETGRLAVSCIPGRATRFWNKRENDPRSAARRDIRTPLAPALRPANGEARFVSVILPVRNGARWLPAQLAALSRQDYEGEWEVVVSDNGSTDTTREIVTEWKELLPSLRVVDSSSVPGAAHARNVGVSVARGDLILICDADDEVSSSWIRAMAAVARHADLIGGALETESLNTESARIMRQFPSIVTKRDPFLHFATGASCGVWKDAVYWLGGWDDSYSATGDDLEFSWRAQLAGFRLGWAEDAIVHYRLREDLPSQVKQLFLGASSRPQLYRNYRHAGMPRLDTYSAGKRWAWLALHLPDLLRGHAKRRNWIRVATRLLGRLYGNLVHRVIYP